MIIIVFLLFDLFQYGKAAIHYAAQYGNLDVTQCLLENGADLNLRDGVRKISQTFCLDSNSLMIQDTNVTFNVVFCNTETR